MASYFVIGASRGIGLEFAKQILESNEKNTLVAGARKTSEGLNNLLKTFGDRLSIVPIDVASDESVAKAAEIITGTHPAGLDYIILNAGIIGDCTRTSQDFLRTFDTNAVSLLRVANNFIPLIKKGQKKTVLSISSSAGSLAIQPQIHQLLKSYLNEEFGYRVSKAALNALNTLLSLEYKEEGISFVLVHPGLVQTEMFYSIPGGQHDHPIIGNFSVPVETSVKSMLQLLHKVTVEDTGKFYDYNGEILPF